MDHRGKFTAVWNFAVDQQRDNSNSNSVSSLPACDIAE